MKQLKKLGCLLGAFAALSAFTPAVHAEDRPGHVGYDKGFYIKTDDGKFKLLINAQLQPQYQFLSIEGQDNINTFQIRRGRLYFSGHAFTENLTYKLEYELVGGRASTSRETELRGPTLLDAYVNYKVNDAFEIQAGQFKPYYNREELSSGAKLQFVDRSMLNDVFSYGYDIGVGIHGAVLDKKLNYGLFVTNEGNGNNTTNANTELLIGGRATYDILGNHGYTMSDVDHSEDHQLVVGGAVNFNRPGNENDAEDDNVVAGGLDLAYRYSGFSLLVEADAGRNVTDKHNVIGTLAQAGYFVLPERLEVVGRGVGVFASDDTAGNGYEFGGGLNYFFKGHNIKLQTDYSVLVNSPLAFQGAASPTKFVTTGNNPGFNQDQVDHRFRTQVQLFF